MAQQDQQTPLGTTPQTGQIAVDQQRNQMLAAIVAALGGGGGGGSLVLAFTSITGNVVLTAANTAVAVDASGGAVTVTLPPSLAVSGKVIIIKKTDTSANQVTVAGTGADTIDGQPAWYILSAGLPLIIMSWGGTLWYVISGS